MFGERLNRKDWGAFCKISNICTLPMAMICGMIPMWSTVMLTAKTAIGGETIDRV